MKKLSVNLDHIATLREARKENFPDPVQAAILCEIGGADGITVHLRQDRRHIKERDLELLRKTIKTELNLEMAPTEEMVNIALTYKPDWVTLVPESPEEVTTRGGLDLLKTYLVVKEITNKLRDAGIKVSIFIEADKRQIEKAKELNACAIEINTDLYTKDIKNREKYLKEIKEASEYAFSLSLNVHAGHGLNYHNIIPLLKIKEIEEFAIGFAIIARAVYVGLKEAVYEMKRLIIEGEK
ncbi:MAG: pyridoxine 5'-phosphate synthase [candidate division WOR-3 bacterium]